MTQKPTIVFVIPYGFNDRLANFPEFILARLLVEEGWHVIGIARREAGEPAYSNVHGIEVHKYNGLLSACVALLKIFWRGVDAVHVHMLRNNHAGFVSSILALMLRIPSAFSEAGLLHDHYLVSDRDDPLGKPISYENVVPSLVSLVKKIAAKPALSSFYLRSYVFHFSLTHSESVVFYSKHNVPIAERLGLRNVRYIPLLLDAKRWASNSTAAAVENTPAIPSEPFALFVGQMKSRKGSDVLLNAIPSIPRDTLPAFAFVSSSSSTEPEEFSELAKKLGVTERVAFYGRASNAKLRQLFEQCSLVVVPSRYEGFGLVPLEAFEFGKPVVASRVEAMTDFLHDGTNAVLVPPKDPNALARGISDIVANASLQQTLIEGGRRTLANMRSDEMRSRWVSFYGSLVAHR